MNSKQRVIAAMEYRQSDRLPRYWQEFWPEFGQNWEKVHGQTNLDEYFGSDMFLVAAIETAWPSQAGLVEQQSDQVLLRTGWGELKRAPAQRDMTDWQQVMGQTIEPGVPERIDPDTIEFEDPLADHRFEKAQQQADAMKDDYFVWCKSGGPYLRAAFMRGEEQFWIDSVEDPQWTKAFVDRVADHITSVAIEAMNRFGLHDTGIAIYDDVAASWGTFVGPERYEQIFMPALRRMVKAYRDAGARWVMHHSDGNVLSLLDMWVDAGIDAINPVEFRTGMDPVKIREQFGNKLVCVGGLDNCEILPRGDRSEVRDHIQHLLQASRDGGYIIGPHSIGPDISIETMQYILELLEQQPAIASH